MRKNEDGYVLLYVLVVLVLLSLTAAAVCSIALHNLQAQRSSVEQMQERYAAEGLGEQFVAKLQAVERNSTSLAARDAAVSAAKAAFEDGAKDADADIASLNISSEPDFTWTAGEGNTYHCAMTVEAREGETLVTASLDAAMTIAVDEVRHYDDDGGYSHSTFNYALSGVTVSYQSYDISAVSSAEEGEST